MTNLMRTSIGLWLLVAACMAPLWSAAATVHLVTPQASPSPPVQRGLDHLETLLSEQGHTVLFSRGSLPQVASALEIIISPFDPQALPAETRQVLDDVVSQIPGAFTVLKIPREQGVRVYAIGSDDVGAMYAAFDLAEQLQNTATLSDFDQRIRESQQSPAIPVRGVKRTIHHDSITDPFSWFHSDSHWQMYLDQLAMARFNLLELCGVMENTTGMTKALWPFFVSNPAAADPAITRNRASLKRIIEMASARGIFISLTSLPDDSYTDGFPLEQIQALWRDFAPIEGVGYQLSGDSEGSANRIMSIIDAHQESPSPPLFIFSTSNPNPAGVQAIADRYRGRTVAKIPMNTLRYGLGYIPPGDVNNSIPLFWNYLKQPRAFGVLFDIQAAPMQALFPWGNHQKVREILSQVSRGGANGFVLDESTPIAHGQFRATHTPEDVQYAAWTNEEQWYTYALWGRLAYDPEWSESAWEQMFEHRFSPDAGPHMLSALQHASHVLPAIQSSRTPGRISTMPLPQLAPPPGLSSLLNDLPADTFTLLSPMEEVRKWTANAHSGREPPMDRLNNAAQHINLALQAIEQAGRHLDPGQQSPIGLIEDETMLRYREWQAWLHDMRCLAHLTTSWLAQMNAAVQYALFLESGDIPSLVLASESMRQSYEAWGTLVQETAAIPPVPLHINGQITPMHWNTMQTSFEADMRLINSAYTSWSTSTTWTGRVGHFPMHQTAPSQSVLLTISIPPEIPTDSLTTMYRNSEGQSSQRPMQSTRIPGVYFTEIPALEIMSGRLEYFFIGTVDGEDFTGRTALNNRPFAISITTDTEGPRIAQVSHSIQGNDAIVTTDVVDPSGVTEVTLVWRQLDSASTWNRTQMQQSENGYRGQISLSEVGAVYAIEAVDTFGYASRFPSLDGLPYRIIDLAAQQ